MVVLSKYYSRAAINLIQDLLSEDVVDRFIGLPIRCLEGWFDESVVAQRPKAFIRESGVIALFFLFGQPNQSQGVRGVVRRYLDAVILIYGKVVTLAAAESDPSAAAFLHQRVNRRDKSASCRGITKLALDDFVHIGLAVGDYDQLVISNLSLYQPLKFFPGPSRFTHHPTPFDPLNVANQCLGFLILKFTSLDLEVNLAFKLHPIWAKFFHTRHKRSNLRDVCGMSPVN